jgi:hypothetical protein
LLELCVSEPESSETMSGTMSMLHLPELHLSGPHLSEPELSETMSEHTFIARIIRNYVRATIIRPLVSETTLELQSSQ